MKKLRKLLGIIAIVTVIAASALVLAGCDSGGDDGGGGGGGGPSLLGNWVDDRDNPGEVFIFTNTDDDGAITGAKVAYYSTNLTAEAQAVANNQISITANGNASSYGYNLNGNTLTLIGYIPAAGTTPAADLAFTRVPGAGSGISGVWVGFTSGQYTLLIIRSGTGSTYTSVGQNGGRAAYTLSESSGTTYIHWNGTTPVSYSLTSDPTNLAITPPGANAQRITGLITLNAW